MKDRVPVNPGRVLITPENGSAAYYATMTRADNPTQAGTPLNKASLLKDATAALFGLGADAVPDDVFAAVKALIDSANAYADTKAKIATGSYTGTGKSGSSNKNTITFDFVPKLVIVAGGTNGLRPDGSYWGSDSFIWTYGQTTVSKYAGSSSSSITCSLSGNTLSWYCTHYEYAVSGQCNTRGTKYRYFAIG